MRHRIEVRVALEHDVLIRQAADIEHETVMAFVVDAVTEPEAEAIQHQRAILPSNDAFDRWIGGSKRPRGHRVAALPAPEVVASLYRALSGVAVSFVPFR